MARLFLTPGQVFDTVGGNSTTDVFGTNSNETVFVAQNGRAVFDPSFNRGGDVINIGGNVQSYNAVLQNSNILITNNTGASIAIPIGTVGATINFLDALGLNITFDGTLVKIGTQTITTTSTKLEGGTVTPGGLFTLTTLNVPTNVDVMRLTGNTDVRIDFTRNTNQVRGLDLNGNGIIESNGVENNNPTKADDGTIYEVVDAYHRNLLNLGDTSKNYLGDIQFDGTGFGGDGVSTNGNIFLGGLGADIAFGGIGNDFLVGGGVFTDTAGPSGRDQLSGGRNADFFFAEFSTLDLAEGDTLTIDGGSTTDDSAVGNNTPQDADWLLFEGSDDEEPYTINLSNEALQTITSAAGGGSGGGSGIPGGEAVTGAKLAEIENVDASGNLYGFIDNIDVSLGEGGKKVNGENVGIGSSAQLLIVGSVAKNIFVGGYDNDALYGEAGDDILFGGNLKYAQNNPNAVGIINDGADELFGGAGDDSIAFEADGGIINGGGTAPIAATPTPGPTPSPIPTQSGIDTLYLTSQSLGTKTAADLTTDGILRFDLAAQILANSAGYGGADVDGTQDQTNYGPGFEDTRVTVTDMDSVIATGLGAIDYVAAGSNKPGGDTEPSFRNQQNHLAYKGDLDLRGTDTTTVDIKYDSNGDGTLDATKTIDVPGDNVLYASTGNDKIEGRGGNDKLSGGDGFDDFIFATLNGNAGIKDSEGVDVIHRQKDTVNNTTGVAGADNIWDKSAKGDYLYTADFGQVGQKIPADSFLRLTIDDLLRDDLQDLPINGVIFSLGGQQYTVTLAANAIKSTYENFVNGLDIALDANPALAALDATLNGDNSITIVDPTGRAFAIGGFTFVNNVVPAIGNLKFSQTVGDPSFSQSIDRLLFTAYEDRADGEKINDNATSGSTISLGTDGYAADRVVGFGPEGTSISEDQEYTIVFDNITTQDKVTVSVNNVTYSIIVGVDADGNSIKGEDTQSGASQTAIQTAALARLASLITNFADDDIASGEITAIFTGPDTIVLKQDNYGLAGDETVFMFTPVVTIDNTSGGEPATREITNTSDHEVLLFEYDGRNNGLNRTNTLFIGDTGVNRSILETAANTGGDFIGLNAQIVDDLADDIQDSVFNTTDDFKIINNQAASAAALGQVFSVHGDDLLMGGTGNDKIKGGTGDDRVLGSLGTDTADGGKDYYRVDVAGEDKARVYLLNTYEASKFISANPSLTVNDIKLIQQTQAGIALAGGFNDTLQFQQADFTAGTTTFTVNLFNNVGDVLYDTATGKFGLVKGGAGTVTTDADNNGTSDAKTTFAEFENIRTVSGWKTGTAGDGQGNDSLILTTISDTSITGPADSGGVYYDLTNRGTAGEVRISTDAHANKARPLEGDFTDLTSQLLIVVDGVENVTTGKGDDLITVDESEAPKNNKFVMDLGDDRVRYLNTFDTGNAAEPIVTIKVLPSVAGVESSTVTMTGGRLGQTTATDTLTDVEVIALDGNTAQGTQAADVLDLTAFATGVIFNYADPLLLLAAANLGAGGAPYGSVRLLDNTLQLVIEDAFELENVWGDGNDTVIVGDSDVMNANANDNDDEEPIPFVTYLDYDTVVAAGTTNTRVPFASQTPAQREEVVNFGLFHFDLSKVGSDADVDTVDYSQATDDILVSVQMDITKDQYVVVDGSADPAPGLLYPIGKAEFDDGGEDRVDQLTSVERIVASLGQSILDLTAMTKSTEVEFSAFDPANRNLTLDRDTYNVRISDLSSGTPYQRGYVEYRDAGQSATTQLKAIWTGVEGGDLAERIILNSAHSGDVMTMNLRGGANEVKYNELTRSISVTLTLTDFVATDPTPFDNTGGSPTGIISGVVRFQDGNGVIQVAGPLTSGTHYITSYTAGNGISANPSSLKIAASQDAEDTIGFAGAVDKLIILGEQGTTDNQITVKIPEGAAATNNSVILTGFEIFKDANSNDLYDMRKLSSIEGQLKFDDNYDVPFDDHDAIKLYGTDGITGGTTIDLDNLFTRFDFDFDVLDVTQITQANLILGGRGGINDELVVGPLSTIGTGSASDFESIVLTQASVAASTTFVFNATAGTLKQGATTYNVGADADALSFGGLLFQETPANANEFANSYVANVTTGVTVTTAGAAAVTIAGGDGNDTITGGAAADTLYGGKGADTLDGNLTAAQGAFLRFTLPGAITTSGNNATAGFDLIVGNDEIATKAAPTGDFQIAQNADDDQIISHYATNFTVPEWQAIIAVSGVTNAANLAAGLQTVEYDSDANTITFRWNTGAAGQTITNANVVGLSDPSTFGNANFAPVVTTSGFVAAVNTVDTFLYAKASDSTEAAMDSILNFNIGAVDDIIDITAANFTGAFNGVTKTTTVADFATAKTVAGGRFGAGTAGDEIVALSNGTDSWIFIDADNDGTLNATDMIIKLTGVNVTAAGFDGTNFVGETGAWGTFA